MTTLTELIRDMVFNCGVPAKAVASGLKKPYTTFLRELNPDDDGAKLGVDVLEDIMLECGNVSPLRRMALTLNYRLVPLAGVEPDKETMAEELLDDLQAVSQYQMAIMVNDDPVVVQEYLELAILELEENMVLYRRKMLMEEG
jgi:hypothetical protein